MLPSKQDARLNHSQRAHIAPGNVSLTMAYPFLLHTLGASFLSSLLQRYAKLIQPNGIFIAPFEVLMTSRSRSLSHLSYPHTTIIQYQNLS